ncbi:GntR family transcriptional regulator [Mycolicibacterium sp. P1-18]|uniref:GntR family transcriptional regulator n=1 Tax=Mycolicibacterium sp. P1-18 TaxID=2024615 RepID=UPI00125340C7|nr:GntR family transcriptional regulator [Mycolicibacterium sp. P1-18]KAA0093644.1 GntR family transcriptional regulator [Mycolicibacterium sp. P1-18]
MTNSPHEPSPVRRGALTGDVADYVRGLVMTGHVREGEFIRVDRIAADLDVSVTPVREGLVALQGERFVELLPRRGFVVRAVTATDVNDIFRIQSRIEGELARRAAAHFAAAGVKNLKVIQAELTAAADADDHVRVEQLDYAFHHEIARSSDSARLRWFLNHAARMSPSRFVSYIEGWTRAAVEGHGAIIEALAAGDAHTAESVMCDHVVQAGQVMATRIDAASDTRYREAESD